MVASASAGRMRCLSASHDGVPLAGDDAVEDEQAGHPGRIEPVVCRPETGSRFHSTAKTYLSRKAVKNTGTATPISEKITAVVSSGRPGAPRGEVAQRDAQHDRQRHRQDRQLDRRRQPGQEDVEGVLPGQHLGRDAEVAVEHALHELRVLDRQRLVEAERGLQGRPALRGLPLPQDRRHRAARQRAQPREHEHRQHEHAPRTSAAVVVRRSEAWISSHVVRRSGGPSCAMPPGPAQIGQSAGGTHSPADG